MQYRNFGNLDWKVSALGFGCMRLPKTSDDPKDIDEPEATRMVRYAIDNGVNYIDTAYPYHGKMSEIVVGRILQDGYREKVHLATKLPVWEVKEYSDFDRLLNEQLGKLQTDHIDFYLLHALNFNSWTKVRDQKVLEWAEGAIKDGRIRYLGFSFHDENPVFEEIVDAYDWTFCQIQYNYLDVEEQAGMKGLKYAASKGLAVVIMEPLLGGALASTPEVINEMWRKSGRGWTPVEWALQWLWNQPEVSVVLSGMSAMEHVVENVACANRSSIAQLPPEEMKFIEKIRQRFEDIRPIPCTDCKYCMPCPNDVEIPGNFAIFNRAAMLGNFRGGGWEYKNNMSEAGRAEQCIQCQECEPKCPQMIKISEWMPVVHDVLGLDKEFTRDMIP